MRFKLLTSHHNLRPVYMELGTPVWWGWFLLFSRSEGHKKKKPTPLDRDPPLHVNRVLVMRWKCQTVKISIGQNYSEKVDQGVKLIPSVRM